MRSIERRFHRNMERYEGWSSLTCFNVAVRGQGFSNRAISHWFLVLVDKDDYQKSEMKQIVHFAERITNIETSPPSK